LNASANPLQAWENFKVAARGGQPDEVPVALIVDSPWLPGEAGIDTRDYFLFPEQWLALSRPMLRPVHDGWTLHYDPGIAVPFRAMLTLDQDETTRAASREAVQAGEAMLWAMYDAISARTLLVRGAESDLLTRETAMEMTERGPRAQLVEFAGVGHAPMFVQPDQVAAVKRFLLEP
jgi:pimeloyl-ACP methyl ester carboxylesterase